MMHNSKTKAKRLVTERDSRHMGPKGHLVCWMCHGITEIGVLEELKKEKAVWIPASAAASMSKLFSKLNTNLNDMMSHTLCI